jgi:hypothetical protein
MAIPEDQLSFPIDPANLFNSLQLGQKEIGLVNSRLFTIDFAIGAFTVATNDFILPATLYYKFVSPVRVRSSFHSNDITFAITIDQEFEIVDIDTGETLAEDRVMDSLQFPVVFESFTLTVINNTGNAINVDFEFQLLFFNKAFYDDVLSPIQVSQFRALQRLGQSLKERQPIGT